MSHLNWHTIWALYTTEPGEININLPITDFIINLRKHYFSARIVNIWNSLPNHVVDVTNVNLVKARLDRFWINQDVKYDFIYGRSDQNW